VGKGDQPQNQPSSRNSPAPFVPGSVAVASIAPSSPLPVHVAPAIYASSWVNRSSVVGIDRAEINDLVLMAIAMVAVICGLAR